MNVRERGIFRIFYVGVIDEILKEEEVPWTTLNNCEKPVP
jgi:hypothetical protein